MAKPSIILALLALATPSAVDAQTYTISTFAGGALPVNIAGNTASLYGPQTAIAIDPTGDVFFVDGNTVLRLDAVSGNLTLVAGNGTAGYSGDNGPAVNAQLHNPSGIALDAAGNLYIASSYDNVVREVSGGVITTIAGTGTAGFSGDNGPAINATLNTPYGLFVDSAGNLYIADNGNNRIRQVSGGVITTIAGNGFLGYAGDNGPAVSASLNSPRGVVVDSSGNLYIADTGNNRIRTVTGTGIATFAGNGTQGFSGDNGLATSADLSVPCGIALDSAGNLYIADYYNNRVRKVSNGLITTVAGKGTTGFSGDGGLATNAQLNSPFVVGVDFTGNLYIADYGNNRIRKVSAGAITTVAGNGTSGFGGDGGAPAGAQLHAPYAVAFDKTGDLFIADYRNNRVREISGGTVNTIAGSGTPGFSGDSGPAASAQLNQPSAIAISSVGDVYIADTGNNRIRKVSAGTISTFAGNGTAGYAGDSGPAANAELNSPSGLAFDSSGNLYIADSANNRIRKISNGTITTVAGNGTGGYAGDGSSATAAQLHSPSGIAVDSTGNLYIADSANNSIRKVTGGVISTVAGNGTSGYSGDNGAATSAQLSAPGGVGLTSNGVMYIADTSNNVLRRVAGGSITTIAGGGLAFGDSVPATSVSLSAPQNMILDATGNVYIADTGDNRIRLLTPIPLSIASPSTLPQGMLSAPYGPVTFTAAGGTGTYTWSATGLPKGLVISASGTLSGTPTVAGAVSPQFTVKDSATGVANTTLSLTIGQPVPTISTISPVSATSGGAAFTLTVNGTGFVTGAAIQWNGTALTTKLVSATQLTASVTTSLIAAPGTITITVNSGGSSSGTASFTINAPTPVLTSISPTSAIASGNGFTLTATGTSFVQASQLEWNGAALPTTFVSATQLTASVSGGLMSSAGTASIVANSGGTSSKTLTFTITPPPAITSLSPSSVTAYGPAFTLTVTGTGFATGDVVQWNSSPLTTKVVSATQLTASVPSNQIGGAGTVSIVVTAGGLSTAASSLTVNPQPPMITSLNPTAAIATGAAFTLSVNGTGFTQNATVLWNGAPLSTTFVAQNQLTAYITASLIANPGTVSVTVTAGGTTTSATNFTVSAPPSITTLSPASVIAGGGSFTLTITGTGFVSGAQVQWNGAALPTTFISATQLTASVNGSQIANIGNVSIQVNYSGASSSGTTLPINGPPSITSLSPASAAAGGAAFTLTVNGTGFVSGSAITWNGAALTTKFVSATQLTASVTASLIASAGAATVAVTTGGASSSPLTLSINAPPAISSLSPGTVVGTGAPFTLIVNGSGFLAGATVEWNGTPLATTFVNSGELTAAVPANLAVGALTATIVATNPGGAPSTAAKLAITVAQPAVAQGGVVPLYSATSVIQAGSWISIYGTGLGNGTYTWTGNYPTSLGGTSVKINNKAAYLWLVSPTQINLQAPTDTATGTVNVVVTTPSGTTTSTVTLAPYGPSFSLLPASNYAAAVILTPDGSGAYGGGTYDLAGPVGQFSFKTRPVKAGETVEFYGVGFGPTSPAVPPGKAFTGAAPTTNPVTVTIGGATAKVLFSGMTGSGVYQFNVVMPAVGSGDQTMLATVGGATSPTNVLITAQ